MFLLIQAITVLFAIALAYLNEVPVVKMINAGASLSEEKKFHRANAIVKVIYSIVIAYLIKTSWVHFAIAFFILSFIQWMIFDIALNLLLKKVWDYTGETALLDKMLNKVFPHGDGGEVKAICCLIVIIVLNILYTWLS